ncbi:MULTISPECIES: Rrf2 family transcriptional regulator [Exiguobacterium]|uniref:RrF2 family transcriptional regulator n=1 Tax=Exiguobacterium TaxID=33986 RepID=UPI001BEB2DAD|nr:MULTISPECIES: Rrf2 family transcriptional regulator [Exiguobacterium]
MKMTRSTDYAIRVLIYAASHPTRLVQIQEVATHYDISKNHLMKIVHSLSKFGLIISVQGRNGGFKLAKSPDTITLGEIVHLFEEVSYLENVTVPNKNGSLQNTRQAFDQAFTSFTDALQAYTLLDLIAPSIND